MDNTVMGSVQAAARAYAGTAGTYNEDVLAALILKHSLAGEPTLSGALSIVAAEAGGLPAMELTPETYFV